MQAEGKVKELKGEIRQKTNQQPVRSAAGCCCSRASITRCPGWQPELRARIEAPESSRASSV
jgi:hypothetical protein